MSVFDIRFCFALPYLRYKIYPFSVPSVRKKTFLWIFENHTPLLSPSYLTREKKFHWIISLRYRLCVNITSILQAANAPISFCQKITKPNCNEECKRAQAQWPNWQKLAANKWTFYSTFFLRHGLSYKLDFRVINNLK